jgi:chromosome segregation ATPase
MGACAHAESERNTLYYVAEKRRGKWPDLFGRLGDLGAIDERYDVAISTTCGALDNLVCQTNKTASECVDHLRATGIGSATFIILDDQGDTEERMYRPFQA